MLAKIDNFTIAQITVTDGFGEADQAVQVMGYGPVPDTFRVEIDGRDFGIYEAADVSHQLWTSFKGLKILNEEELGSLIEKIQVFDDNHLPQSAYDLLLDGKFLSHLISVVNKDNVNYTGVIRSLMDYSIGVDIDGNLFNYGQPFNDEPKLLTNVLQTPTVVYPDYIRNNLGDYLTRKVNFRYIGAAEVVQSSDGEVLPAFTLDTDFQTENEALIAVMRQREAWRISAITLTASVPLDISLKPNTLILTKGLEYNDWIIQSLTHSISFGSGHTTQVKAYAVQNVSLVPGSIQFNYLLVKELLNLDYPIVGTKLRGRFIIVDDIDADTVDWKWFRINPNTNEAVLQLKSGRGGIDEYTPVLEDFGNFLEARVRFFIDGEDKEVIKRTPAVRRNSPGTISLQNNIGEFAIGTTHEVRLGDTLIATVSDPEQVTAASVVWLWEKSTMELTDLPDANTLYTAEETTAGDLKSTFYLDVLGVNLINHAIRVTVKYSDALGVEQVLQRVIPRVRSLAFAAPTGGVTPGAPIVGTTLTATLDDPDDYYYQSVHWFRALSSDLTADPATWTVITEEYVDPSKQSFDYTVTLADVGFYIIVIVRIINTPEVFGETISATTTLVPTPVP